MGIVGVQRQPSREPIEEQKPRRGELRWGTELVRRLLILILVDYRFETGKTEASFALCLCISISSFQATRYDVELELSRLSSLFAVGLLVGRTTTRNGKGIRSPSQFF